MEHRTARNGSVDVLRLIFAALILLHHARKVALDLDLFAGGHISVFFFFLVSGYFMAHSALRALAEGTQSVEADTLHHFKRRFLALMPCYLVAFLINFIVVELIGDTSIRKFMGDALFSAVGLMPLAIVDITPAVSLGGSWFLSALLIAEAVLYPLIRRNGKRFIQLTAPLVSILLLGYLITEFGNLGNPFGRERLLYAGLMQAFAGISLGTTLVLFSARRWKFPLQIILYAMVFIIAMRIGKTQLDALLVALMYLALTQTISAPRIADSRLTRLMGSISYPLFFAQMPVILVMDALSLPLPAGVLIVIYVLASFAAAFALRALSRPVARLFSRWITR